MDKYATLYAYQRTGIQWLLQAWRECRNAILADEMGLGKTLQTIGLISEMITRFKITRPYLVVVPLTTIENWRREF